MPTNEILQFAAEGSEAAGDLLSQAEYAAHPYRSTGHQVGIARRAVENRVLRQVSHMAAGLAQFIANRYTPGVVDDADLDKVEEGLAEAIRTFVVTGYGKNLGLAGQVLSLLSETGATLGQVTLPSVTGYGKNLSLSGLVLSLLSETGATLGQVTLPTLPPGTVIAHAAASAPAGFLACDGSAASRTTYAALYAAIGTLYGSGDGSTTFNLPNLVNDFVRGAGAGRPVGTRESDELRSHNHQSRMYDNGRPQADGAGTGESANPSYSYNSADNSGLICMTGAAGGAETRPRNVALLYVIKY